MEQDLNAILQEQLRGIHLPETVSWWPPAPGWWLLLVLMLYLLGWCLWLFIQFKQENLHRKQAIRELGIIHRQWLADANTSLYVQSANAIIKRALIAAGNNQHISSLTGAQWAKNLNCRSTILTEESTSALAEAGYQQNPEVDINQLHSQLLDWLRLHKKPIAKQVDTRTGGPSNV